MQVPLFERETLSEAVVSLRTVTRSWHGWFLEQSFLVRNSFYNDIFADVRFKRFGPREKVVYKHVCTKWSFAVSFLCLAHHAVRLWFSPRCCPRGATNPVQIPRHWSCARFLPSIHGRWPSLLFFCVKLPVHPNTAQEWTNRTPNATNLSIPCFLVLPGSESTITEITEYIYFSRI